MKEKKSPLLGWINAIRIRTLLLALASMIVGNGLAWDEKIFDWKIAILSFLTAISLQILANLSNDMGDFLRGTDRSGMREGPERSLQSGSLNVHSMKTGILLNVFISIVLGSLLVFFSFDSFSQLMPLLFLALGGLSVVAAIYYTMGRNPYGYRGLGDLFVFLFFGPMAVMGAFYLQTKTIPVSIILPSISMGCVSTCVMNINNMRDLKNDKICGKKTLAVILGERKSKIYHLILILLSFGCFFCYSYLKTRSTSIVPYLYLLSYLPLFVMMRGIFEKHDRNLDPYLKKTSIASLFIAILFVVFYNL